jgi:hypothetical protein
MCHKKLQVAMKKFYYIENKILFCTIVNMMIIFHFIFKMLKNPILKVDLNRIFFNASIGTRCLIVENGLNVDEIFI